MLVNAIRAGEVDTILVPHYLVVSMLEVHTIFRMKIKAFHSEQVAQ